MQLMQARAAAESDHEAIVDAASAPSLETHAGDEQRRGPDVQLETSHELPDPLSAAILARQARSKRIARIAILVSGLLCVVALARSVVAWETGPSGARLPETAGALPSGVGTLATAPLLIAATTLPAAGRVEAPSPSTEAEGTGTDREAARRERLEAQTALELGDLKRAVRSAEQAVDHDPTEAEGWLLLVAAHLDLHDRSAAHAALRSCAEHATGGPRGECMALIQSSDLH